MKKLLSIYTIFLVFLLIPAFNAGAGNIDVELRKALQIYDPLEEIPVIITLTDKADLALIRDKNKKARRAKIIRELRSEAAITQGELNSFLNNRNAGKIRQLWIINAIAARVPAQMISELAALPGIGSVSLDYTISAPVMTTGMTALPEWNITAIKAPDVWTLGYTGAGVVVANMDTGVDIHHPDLQAKWRGGTNSWYDPNGEHVTPDDAHGHGTQTMGVIVGGTAGGMAIGVVPDAKWIAVKIFNDAGVASISAIHQGFQWLLDPDGNPDTNDAPDVINASWGFPENAGQCIPEFQQDIQNLKTADIEVVFAGGNSGPSANTSESPANNPGSFAAGAVDNTNTIASFSSRGPSACDGSIFPHIVAPGVNITTSDLTGGGVFPDSYAYVTGTSFAAPHVAGAVALLLSAFPDAAISDIETAIEQTALDLGVPGSDNIYGNGLVDVMNAYSLLLATAASPDINVVPALYNFGSTVIQTSSASTTFTITNKGTADLVMGTISLTGQNFSEFRIPREDCSGKTIGPQLTCTIDILFSPVSTGIRTAFLTLPSNDPDSSSLNVSLQGTGAPPPPLTLTVPNGGENWTAGTGRTITWKYTGNPGNYLKIELLKGGVLNRTITSYASKGSNGTGSYNWTIPSNQTLGTDFRIRITSTANAAYTDTSNGNFTILGQQPPPPAGASITVRSPNGGERWSAGGTYAIMWSYTGNPGTLVRIQVFKGAIVKAQTFVSTGTGGTGSFNWAIPLAMQPGTDYKVKITSTTNPAITDMSNANFSIVP